VLIFLTHANHLYSDRKQVRKMQPYPPLQTLIAAALLRRDGHEVVFFDCTFDRDFLQVMDARRPDLVAVCEDNFNFLTKMCLLENRELAFSIAAAARERGIPSIVNSSDSTGNPQAYLAAGFDRVILGELEGTLSELCRNWQSKPPQIEYDPARAIADLDELPMPAWDLVDMEAYRRAWMDAHGYFSLNLAASRGCPYRCNWCAKPVHGDAYRRYSPDRAAAELECVRDLFAPDQIWFTDDIFGLSGKWAREFAACVERRGARIPFRMQSRCDLMTRETVVALRRAGCVEVWMGAESGAQHILDAMDKGTRVEHIYAARENLRRHGIRAGFFLQFGYPGETWEDIQSTICMVRETAPDDIGVSVSYPLPGTKFHERVAAELGPKVNWNDSGDLDMMFHGAYTSEFYRELADALHAEVRGGTPRWDRVHELERTSAMPALSL
jgi:anaerobic magnesium-protoporphyrin IX monomethyl ester cyclase